MERGQTAVGIDRASVRFSGVAARGRLCLTLELDRRVARDRQEDGEAEAMGDHGVRISMDSASARANPFG